MNRKIKILITIFLAVFVIAIGKINVNAASASISASKTSINLGETITITTTINGASWDINLSGAISEGYADTTGDAENSTKTYTYSYTPTAVGTYNIALTGNVTDSNATTATSVSDELIINVTQKVQEPPANNTTSNDSNNNNNSSKNNNNKPAEKSSEARLVDFGIRPKKYDFDNFKPDDYENSVEVPNDVKNIEVYAKTLDSKATIQSGTGNVELKEGLNKVEVVVVAEDGKTKHTYTLNITRLSAENPATEPTQSTEPTTEPTTDTTSTEATNVDEFGLSSLTIAGLNINPKFSTTTYEYTAGLTQDLSTLEIEAKATSETGVVEIFGNEDLQQGENTITIVVSDTADAEKSATYQITINKNYVPQTVEEVSWLNPSTWGLKQYVIIGTLVVLIIIVIVAIILKVKLSKMDEEDEIEFPGVEELDKALTEHQELTNFDENNKNQDNDFTTKNKKLFEDNDNNNVENDDQDKNISTREKVKKLFDNEEIANTSKKKGKHF